MFLPRSFRSEAPTAAYRTHALLKTWLSCCLLLLAGLANSLRAAWPEEVAGNRWGASPDAVRQVMSSRGGITAATQAPGKLTFQGGSVSGLAVTNWVFEFANDKLSRISLTFAIRQGGDSKGDFVAQDFLQLQRLLESKYGKPRQGKLRAEADPNFDAFHWQFTDALNPKAWHTIELYHGWKPKTHGSSHLEIVYNAAASAGKLSLSPVKSGDGGL